MSTTEQSLIIFSGIRTNIEEIDVAGVAAADGGAAVVFEDGRVLKLGGFKFALLTKMTGSLYMAMGDHFVNNTIVNMLHVVSDSGADELMFVRMSIAQALSFVIVLIVYLKKRHV